MPATARELQTLLDSLEPAIARAFLDSVAAIKSRARIGELTEAIEANDIEAALYAAGIREYSWVRVPEAVRDSYLKAGRFTVGKDIPASYGLDFNVNNPRAQRWIDQTSSRLVAEISQGQRAAVTEAISAGFTEGRNPRAIALDVVGRVSPQTGRRDGGLIGLHEQFAQYATNARTDLQTLNPAYFQKTRRDRRFDAMVRKSFEDGKPLSQAKINQLVGRYEDRLMQTRGNNIARTEALSSMNAAGYEAMDQARDEGLITSDGIAETWDASFERTRSTHRSADGQTVMHGQPFTVGGYRMLHPGDSSLGAPASEIVNCACVVRRKLDFSKANTR